MKKTILAIVLAGLAVAACTTGGGGGGAGPAGRQNAASLCQEAWDQADVPAEDSAWFVGEVLNREWPPDSVGAAVQQCIRDGWDGWR